MAFIGTGGSAGLVRRTLAAYVPLQHPPLGFQQELEEKLHDMKAAFLSDRGVVKVSGEDARNFLNGLVTTNVELVHPGQGRCGALLTPQRKIIVDFRKAEIPAGHGGGFLRDRPKTLAKPLAARLSI